MAKIFLLATSYLGSLALFLILNLFKEKINLQWASVNRLSNGFFIIMCIVLPFASLPGRFSEKWLPQYERWFIVTEFDNKLVEWLDKEGIPGEMILSTIIPRTQLQAKTGYPVLFEVETLWLMTYMPELASTIGNMVYDLYGIDYEDLNKIEELCNRDQTGQLCPEGQLSSFSPVWMLNWEKRSIEDWQLLGQKYNFRLVVAPTVLPLKLPVVFSSEGKSLIDGLTLYEIPESIGLTHFVGEWVCLGGRRPPKHTQLYPQLRNS